MVITEDEKNVNLEVIVGTLVLAMIIIGQLNPDSWVWLFAIVPAAAVVPIILALAWDFLAVVIGGFISRLESASSAISAVIILVTLILLGIFTPLGAFFFGHGWWGAPYIISGLLGGVVLFLKWCGEIP